MLKNPTMAIMLLPIAIIAAGVAWPAWSGALYALGSTMMSLLVLWIADQRLRMAYKQMREGLKYVHAKYESHETQLSELKNGQEKPEDGSDDTE